VNTLPIIKLTPRLREDKVEELYYSLLLGQRGNQDTDLITMLVREEVALEAGMSR
jgi:hypothetical protein